MFESASVAFKRPDLATPLPYKYTHKGNFVLYHYSGQHGIYIHDAILCIVVNVPGSLGSGVRTGVHGVKRARVGGSVNTATLSSVLAPPGGRGAAYVSQSSSTHMSRDQLARHTVMRRSALPASHMHVAEALPSDAGLLASCSGLP